MGNCTNCIGKCEKAEVNELITACPSLDKNLINEAKAEYFKEENKTLAKNAALVEKEGYCQLTRIEEIMDFAKKNNMTTLGLAFCVGLKNEAREVSKIFTHNGFTVLAAACKNGIMPKSTIDLENEQTLSGNKEEIMCNPIGQAMYMNKSGSQLNIILGLCVGHDSLFIKYATAPITVLAVKDRVTGHNPLAAVYNANSYYKKKLYK